MGHKSARVGGDRTVGLTETDSCRFTADDPTANYRVIPVEARQFGGPLVDVALFTVVTSRLHGITKSTAVDPDVGALTREQRLPRVSPGQHLVGRLTVRFQQVGVTVIQLPENGQDALVRENHFPGRLDEQSAAARDMPAKRLVDDPFPRVEFEQREDRLVFLTDENVAVPTDLVDRQANRTNPRFFRRLTQVRNRQSIFYVIDRREVNDRWEMRPQIGPGRDQLLMD